MPYSRSGFHYPNNAKWRRCSQTLLTCSRCGHVATENFIYHFPKGDLCADERDCDWHLRQRQEIEEEARHHQAPEWGKRLTPKEWDSIEQLKGEIKYLYGKLAVRLSAQAEAERRKRVKPNAELRGIDL